MIRLHVPGVWDREPRGRRLKKKMYRWGKEVVEAARPQVSRPVADLLGVLPRQGQGWARLGKAATNP